MSDKMLKFINIGQQNPPKRGVTNRKDDFNEIYKEFIQEKAGEQASRCSQCGVPFCQVHCPLSNNIPDWPIRNIITVSYTHLTLPTIYSV